MLCDSPAATPTFTAAADEAAQLTMALTLASASSAVQATETSSRVQWAVPAARPKGSAEAPQQPLQPQSYAQSQQQGDSADRHPVQGSHARQVRALTVAHST